MGANAAVPLLNDEEIDSIGMLIVGTEGSVDFGKPISTNIHGALGLSSSVRNYETKHACYSGVAALDTAINWIASGLNRGRKALVISTDFSRVHMNIKEEFVLGGVATALLLSDRPQIIEYETNFHGTWTTDIYDTFRPSARHEVGNNEVSLFTYMDALQGAYEDYCRSVDREIDFDSWCSYVIYHTPFPGIAFQAHRTLSNLQHKRGKREIRDNFERRVVPSLRFARRVGSTYGSSNFVGLCSLLTSIPNIPADTRIGFFAYGSGAIGEFYSARVCERASEKVAALQIEAALDARLEIDVEQYEQIERIREQYIEQPDFVPDRTILDGWYDRHYAGKRLLTLAKVENFYRTYEWG